MTPPPDVGHHLLGNKRFDRVTDLHVVEILNANAALVSACDFGSILLESLQRSDLAFEDDHVVAQETNFSVACEFAIGDVAARNHTDFRNTECISNVRRAK